MREFSFLAAVPNLRPIQLLLEFFLHHALIDAFGRIALCPRERNPAAVGAILVGRPPGLSAAVAEIPRKLRAH